ncbi:hypothetical protein [Staphylococcus saprophyticus]|uniref:hypothetical protein n=1 Tax=Staphylococcus saprophyticus TaxID=29385 RepID=UPI0014024B3A|nr:hypothetical protein [Staphylococcus saprophyticus]
MKIKTKKQLNLPQLIEYIWDNDIKNEFFRRLNRGPFEYVWVNEDSNIEFDDNILFRKNDIFEIEVEEEITKDTKLPSVLVYDGKYFNALYGLSINDIEKSFIDYVYGVKTIHLIDGDTHTLIWRNGKLVV